MDNNTYEINRPNDKNVKSVLESIDKYYDVINKYWDYDEYLKSCIKIQYNQAKMASIERVVDIIPMEQFANRAGISSKLYDFRNKGILTVGQLRRFGYNSTLTMKGIGTATADKIFGAIHDLQNEECQKLRFRFDMTKNEHIKLLRLLHAYSFCKNEILNMAKNADMIKENLEDKYRLVDGIPSKWKWIFYNQNRKMLICNAFVDLDNFTRSKIYHETMVLSFRIEEAENRSAPEVVVDYNNNSISYYAWLEEVMGVEYDPTKGKNTTIKSNTLVNSVDIAENSNDTRFEFPKYETPRHIPISGFGKKTYNGVVIDNMNNANLVPEELVSNINSYEINSEKMKSKLRKYQEFGVKFILHQKRTLLGDEMGLGKTIQAIAAMSHLATYGKKYFLVICPLSVLVNWEREIERHSTLNHYRIYGENKDFNFNQWIDNGGVAITNYESLRLYGQFLRFNIEMLVVDEAHYVKNRDAIRTKNVLSVVNVSNHVLYMTGTPLENKVEEMIFLIGCLQPNVAERVISKTEISNADEFKMMVAPVYLRRVRNDVLEELPEKIEVEDWGSMNSIEVSEYVKCLQTGTFMELRQHAWKNADLRNSSKMKRLKEIQEDAISENRRLVVFSFFLNTLDVIKEEFGSLAYGPISGKVSAFDRQKIIDDFNSSPVGSVLICQIQSGGVGLNIQAASVVVICEPQYKPSIENQAISRAYRMGQLRDVIVHRLVTENTIDEKLMTVLKMKQGVFDAFADESSMDKMSGILDKDTTKSILLEELHKYNVTRNVDEMI